MLPFQPSKHQFIAQPTPQWLVMAASSWIVGYLRSRHYRRPHISCRSHRDTINLIPIESISCSRL